MGFPAIKRRRLYEDIASSLEQMIRDADFLPGDQLPSERELMVRFGVGRPAVREALFHLQKMGVVEVRSGGRARVTRPTPKVVVAGLAGAARHLLAEPDGVRQFQSARAFFEIGLVRHAAEHATEDDLRDLAAALEANRQTIHDIDRFERTDVAFHFVLALIPRNPIFTALHEAIAAWLIEQRRITLSYPGQNEVAYRAHAEIYQSIASRDPNRSEQVMRSHLDQVSDMYWRTVDSNS
ncbi:MAG TPA: transcriptional regulator NanR [Dongiaceae bacterium]|jgi:GntR family transcriptional repressor for pyruvate dehydrogenase complex